MRHEINEKIWKNRHFFQWFTHIVGGKILENPLSGNLPLVVDIPQEYIHPDGGLVMPENMPEKIRALHEKLNICYDRNIIRDIHDATMWQILYSEEKYADNDLRIYDNLNASMATEIYPEHCYYNNVEGTYFGKTVGFQRVQDIQGVKCTAISCRYDSNSKWKFYWKFDKNLPALLKEGSYIRVRNSEIEAYYYTGQTCGMQRARLTSWVLRQDEDGSYFWEAYLKNVEM